MGMMLLPQVQDYNNKPMSMFAIPYYSYKEELPTQTMEFVSTVFAVRRECTAVIVWVATAMHWQLKNKLFTQSNLLN